MVTQEKVSVWFNNSWKIQIDVLDALILFSYFTEEEIQLPLWKLHGKASANDIMVQIGYRELYDVTSVKVIDANGHRIRKDTPLRSEVRAEIRLKHSLKY